MTDMIESTGSEPGVSPFVRSCLLQLMHDLAADKEKVRNLTGQLWLTYPKGRRLRAMSVSGNFPQVFLKGKTFPEALMSLAEMMSSPHGHVMCHSMIPTGFTGAITVGHTMYWNNGGRNLTRPRPMLVGVIVQFDSGQELLLAMDPEHPLAIEPDSDLGLDTVVANTWTVAETIDNMARAPLSPDALKLAQEILDVEPTIALGSGRRMKVSGSDVEGSTTWNMARNFLNKVAAVMPQPENPEPAPRRQPGTVVIGDMGAVNVYTNARLDPVQTHPVRTYRTVD